MYYDICFGFREGFTAAAITMNEKLLGDLSSAVRSALSRSGLHVERAMQNLDAATKGNDDKVKNAVLEVKDSVGKLGAIQTSIATLNSQFVEMATQMRNATAVVTTLQENATAEGGLLGALQSVTKDMAEARVQDEKKASERSTSLTEMETRQTARMDELSTLQGVLQESLAALLNYATLVSPPKIPHGRQAYNKPKGVAERVTNDKVEEESAASAVADTGANKSPFEQEMASAYSNLQTSGGGQDAATKVPQDKDAASNRRAASEGPADAAAGEDPSLWSGNPTPESHIKRRDCVGDVRRRLAMVHFSVQFLLHQRFRETTASLGDDYPRDEPTYGRW